jgi:hypothetical protein
LRGGDKCVEQRRDGLIFESWLEGWQDFGGNVRAGGAGVPAASWRKVVNASEKKFVFLFYSIQSVV